jgi:hypothetical protein
MARNHKTNQFMFVKRIPRSAFDKSGPRPALIKCGPRIFFRKLRVELY